MPSKLRESSSLKKFNSAYWKKITGIIEQHVKGGLPSVSAISRESADPFKVLVSTIISLRTKDKVTFESSARLFEKADTPEKTAIMESEEISRLIYPAGFFRKKGENIKEISRIILERHGGRVPERERSAPGPSRSRPEDCQPRPQSRLGNPGHLRGYPRTQNLQPNGLGIHEKSG